MPSSSPPAPPIQVPSDYTRKDTIYIQSVQPYDGSKTH